MRRDPISTGKEKRDQQTNFMLTKSEKERFDRWRERRGMSISAAARYLILMGLDQEEGE